MALTSTRLNEVRQTMATTKANRSVSKKQSAPSSQRSVKAKSKTKSQLSPGQLGLLERKFQDRRFVEFPQVKGKTTERVQLYTATDYHSITIEFEDETSLLLRIEPGFTINAELQQKRKGNLHTLADWPPIKSH